MLTADEQEYIDSIPDKKTFHLKEWDPTITKVADELIANIQSISPELGTHFMGSAALGLPGENDIDLDVTCARKDLDKYQKLLIPILGTPKEVSESSVQWRFNKDGVEVDVILSDPKTSHFPRQEKVFKKLRSSHELRKKLHQLKVSHDGKSYKNYVRAKIEFFHRVLDE